MPTSVSTPRGESSSKLRPITPAEVDRWTTALRDQAFSNFEFIDLDEPHDYPFKVCNFIITHVEDLN